MIVYRYMHIFIFHRGRIQKQTSKIVGEMADIILCQKLHEEEMFNKEYIKY